MEQFGDIFNNFVSIHIPVWCVVDYPEHRMLKWISWDYSFDWFKMMGGIYH